MTGPKLDWTGPWRHYSEATLVPQKQHLQCTYALPDISLSEGGEMDEEQTICLENEVMNPNNGDYSEREEEDEDMSSSTERVKSVTKNGGKSKKCTIEVPDSESNTRTKKNKDSAATKRLTPDETVGKRTEEDGKREDVSGRKKGVLLCKAVNGM